VHEDGGEATLKALVGQVSDPGHLLGPNRMREGHGLRSPNGSWCSLTRSRDQPRLTSGEVSKKLCPRLSCRRGAWKMREGERPAICGPSTPGEPIDVPEGESRSLCGPETSSRPHVSPSGVRACAPSGHPSTGEHPVDGRLVDAGDQAIPVGHLI